jgi:hypothetical protein
LILLIVTIGLLNICLGFGLAMYFGFGPPGLDGIFEAMATMPPAAPTNSGPTATELGAPYDPFAAQAVDEPSARLAEERVLGDVRDLADTAQTAVRGDPVESRE